MTVLVVGGGKMGLSHLALITPYLQKSRVALVERKVSVRAFFFLLGYRCFASLDDAVKKTGKPEGVIIATPTSAHAALADWAISNRVPFFVEKPLTLDPDRSRSLAAAAKASGAIAQMGFVMRYVASFQRLRQVVTDGRLGPIFGYRATMLGNVVTKPPRPGSWQGDFRLGGGCLNEYGPHVFDLCRFIFGDVTDVHQASKGHTHSTLADDWIKLEWSHRNGIQGSVDINWCDTSKRKSVIEFEVEFEAARVRADNSAFEVFWKAECDLDPATRSLIDSPVLPPRVAFYLRGEEFSLEMEAFLSMCLGTPMHVDSSLPEGVAPKLEDGYEVDRLIDMVAAKAGLK